MFKLSRCLFFQRKREIVSVHQYIIKRRFIVRNFPVFYQCKVGIYSPNSVRTQSWSCEFDHPKRINAVIQYKQNSEKNSKFKPVVKPLIELNMTTSFVNP